MENGIYYKKKSATESHTSGTVEVMGFGNHICACFVLMQGIGALSTQMPKTFGEAKVIMELKGLGVEV